jgi:hypothetical protein
MADRQAILLAFVALASLHSAAAWQLGRATFYGKDGW